MNKRKTVIILAAVFLVLVLITGLLSGCTPPKKKTTSSVTPTKPASSSTVVPAAPNAQQVTTLTKQVSDLQSQFQKLSADKAALQKQNQDTQTELELTKARISITEADIRELRRHVSASSVIIGVQPTVVNNLSVFFLLNNQSVTSPGSATKPSYVQLAIKLVNNNDYDLLNVDIIGTITLTFGTGSSTTMAVGYPTLIDEAKAFIYSSNYSESNILSFETYSTGKEAINIPAGKSITLRPRVGVLQVGAGSAMTLSAKVSISAITYDESKPPVK